MDNDTNLESLFDDVFSGTQEAPAGDDGQQKEDTPAEENKEQAAEQEPQEQSKDERAAQAAARREREERERRREQRAYQQARTEMSNLLRELGIEKEDGGIIESLEDLEAVAKARRDDRLSKGNPTGDDIKQIVREEMQSAQRQAQAPQQKASDNRLVQEQLAQIKAMDPAMTDLKSILESDAGQRFREYVAKGLDFVDAYKLAAEGRLAGIKSNRQGARTGGKDHLTSTSQRGGGDIDVPQETRDMYKLLMPEMSEAEIQKAYNADRKKYGG